MNISPSIHRRLRLKNRVNTIALIVLLIALAWSSTLYPLHYDTTAGARNTLSPISQNVLSNLPYKIEIKAYIEKDPPLRKQMTELIERYRRHKPDIELTFIDPASQPEQVRALEIGTAGTVFVEYRGRSERIGFLEESTLTNALQQLSRSDERWISFLTGHGERAPDGRANFDFGRFGTELAQRNIRTQMLNLAEVPAIPDNSDLLVVAGPRVDWLTGETNIIVDYLDRGGHLLWFLDPDSVVVDTLAKRLGLERMPGLLIGKEAKLYGIDDPSFIVVSRYSGHPITDNLQTLTLFPTVAALKITEPPDFKASIVLRSSEQGGSLQPFAYALTRHLTDDEEQRIVAIGDGDFLTNAYIGNVGNLELGLRMVNWLLRDERYVSIPARPAPDGTLQLSRISVATLGFGFLIFIPLFLLSAGLLIWRQRKQR